MKNNNANHEETEQQHLFLKMNLANKIQNVAITVPILHQSKYAVVIVCLFVLFNIIYDFKTLH